VSTLTAEGGRQIRDFADYPLAVIGAQASEATDLVSEMARDRDSG
jgi:hypothetical protein